MAIETHQLQTINSRSLVLSILLLVTLTISLHVQASRIPKGVADENGVVKTIRSEDGDVIDCVDIYRQPAFSHPLLKNHAIQMKPSSYPVGINSANNSNPPVVQPWHKNGGFCPTGTIPIARSKLNLPRKTARARVPASFANHRYYPEGKETDPTGHEFVQASIVGGYYYGATANINVWSPTVQGAKEFSTAQLWVYSAPEINIIEAGWMVTKKQSQPIIFISWTRDEYNTTGCYNLECPGFVQTNTKYALGSTIIAPVSTYGGDQRQVSMTIHKDLNTSNWWFSFQGEQLGYFPSSIFTTLAESAKRVSWGGEVMNSAPGGGHTTTGMGSGHYAGEGFGKASYFQNVAYLTSDGVATDPERIEINTSREQCYTIDFSPNVPAPSPGTHFYFGGPGASPSCTY